MAQGQHAENLAWMRERWPRIRWQDAWLGALAERAWAGEGQLLRVSPHRTVIRLDDEQGRSWLCKFSHPRRRWEWLRRLFREGAAIRERDACQRLQARLGLPLAAWAEEAEHGLGLFVRPYWEGAAASPDARTAAALAQLHRLKWLDRDLDLADLLWIETEDEAVLLPLDLGHAEVAAFPLPAEQVYRSLVRVLAQLPTDQAQAWAPQLLQAHEDLIPGWSLPDLQQRVQRVRRARIWKRSRRAFRTCSDFQETAEGVRRREFEERPPKAGEGVVLSAGPRSTTAQLGKVVWKFYPRPGWLQGLRRRRRQSPGALAYRGLAALELMGLAASRGLAWLPQHDGEWIATSWVEGEPADVDSLPELARWLGRLHLAGFGLRDAKCSNFRLQDGLVALIDADGLTPRDHDRARDLARLLAELPADGPASAPAELAYAECVGPLDDRFMRRVRERCEFFRAKLRAADEQTLA